MDTRGLSNSLRGRSQVLYELSEQEQKALKTCLLHILKDIIGVCEKKGLTYMLGGGSALGAVRHQGFIPWDDDLDLLMPREDYLAFIDAFEETLSQEYLLRAPNTSYDCSNNFLKVVRKGTSLIEMDNASAPFEKGVFVDIFPLDYAPRNQALRRLKGCTADFLAIMGVSQYLFKYRNDSMREFYCQTAKGRAYYHTRMLMGRLASIRPYQSWYNVFDRFVQGKKSGMLAIPTGRKHYLGECLPKEVYLPVAKGTFEGLEVCLPHDPDAYLTNLYGDYMELPPEEKRERHYVVGFSAGEPKKDACDGDQKDDRCL